MTAEICWRVWATPANFNGFLVLPSLLQRRRLLEANQTLCDVWPSPWLPHWPPYEIGNHYIFALRLLSFFLSIYLSIYLCDGSQMAIFARNHRMKIYMSASCYAGQP